MDNLMNVGQCRYWIDRGRLDYETRRYNPPANVQECHWYEFGYQLDPSHDERTLQYWVGRDDAKARKSPDFPPYVYVVGFKNYINGYIDGILVRVRQ